MPIKLRLMKPILKNSSGFGLIQVLVALGILGILVSGLMTIMANSYKHETNLNTLLEARELSGELMELVKSTNCGMPDLETPFAAPASLWEKSDILPLSKGISGRFLELKAGDTYGKFKINQISISPYFDRKTRSEKYVAMEGSDPSDFANSSIIKASLRLDITATNTPKAPIRTPVYLYLDNTKSKIIGCMPNLENTDLAAVCGTLGGNWTEADNKCQLPCPPGLDEENGVCIAKSPDTENEDTFCNVDEKCGVAAKYIL